MVGDMKETEVIKLVKPTPSDQLARKVLVMWYNSTRPRWKKPLDIFVTVFFVITTMFLFYIDTPPGFIWLSLFGALAAILMAWGYVPLMVKNYLNANKKDPVYHEEKNYVFYEEYLTFSCKSIPEGNIAYSQFTTLCRTPYALLMLVGPKLVFWLPLGIMTAEQTESIMARFRKQGVEVKELS